MGMMGVRDECPGVRQTDECLVVRGQLCELVPSFHLYVGLRDQTVVTRLVQPTIEPPRWSDHSYHYQVY